MQEFKGIAPIVQTPFTEDGQVDYDSLKNLVNQSIADGADALVLFGLSSEFYKLHSRERLQMVETAARVIDGRVPLVASVTPNSTVLCVEEAQAFQNAGADIIMMFPPQVYPTTTKEMLEHIETIARAIELPFLVQYTPDVAGGEITPRMLWELSHSINQRMYVKAEPKNVLGYCRELRELSGGTIGMFTGFNGMHMIELLKQGVIGIMPGCSSLKAYKKVFQTYVSGEVEEATRLYDLMLSFITKMSINNNCKEDFISMEKYILRKRGIIMSDHIRKPALISRNMLLYQELEEARSQMFAAMNLQDW